MPAEAAEKLSLLGSSNSNISLSTMINSINDVTSGKQKNAFANQSISVSANSSLSPTSIIMSSPMSSLQYRKNHTVESIIEQNDLREKTESLNAQLTSSSFGNQYLENIISMLKKSQKVFLKLLKF